jgi:group I intron endonuclease
MFYTVYKTTNKINGKIYVGSHKTNNLHDSYLGSGKHLLRAISKYGEENFTRELLFVFDNPEDMFAKENEIVNEDFVKRSDTYNLKLGGFGGFDHIDNTGRPMPDHLRQLLSEHGKKRVGPLNTFYGKSHSEETKEKIGAKSKQRAKKQYDERIKLGNHPNSFVDCPHCGKHGQYRALKRWHFDNCATLKTSQQQPSLSDQSC